MLERVMGITPPPPVLASAKAKYQRIGGKSPLVDIAQNICDELLIRWKQASKNSGTYGGEYVQHCEVGMCYTEPYLEDSLARLAQSGCEQVVYLSMTPFESFVAWSQPYQRTLKAASELGISKVIAAPVFGSNPSYKQAHTELLSAAMESAKSTSLDRAELVFVAHSLPVGGEHEISSRYEQQLLEACGSIASSLESNYGLTYVSAGARGGQWLGPSLLDYLKDLVEKLNRTSGTAVIVCPLGFATDHMEVLYDLDIAAADAAQQLGLNFVRTPTLATIDAVHPALIASLVDSVLFCLTEGSVL
jgi:ferrochelatase